MFVISLLEYVTVFPSNFVEIFFHCIFHPIIFIDECGKNLFLWKIFWPTRKIVVNVEIIQIFVLSLRTASICIKAHKTPKLNIWSYLWTATHETFYVYWRSPVFLSIYIQIELFYICGCCSYFIVNSLGRRSFLSFSTFCWKYWLDKQTYKDT